MGKSLDMFDGLLGVESSQVVRPPSAALAFLALSSLDGRPFFLVPSGSGSGSGPVELSITISLGRYRGLSGPRSECGRI